MADDYDVTVCDACLCASCWHGLFMCQHSKDAGTVTKRASELRALSREHPDWFSREQIRKHTGVDPMESRHAP